MRARILCIAILLLSACTRFEPRVRVESTPTRGSKPAAASQQRASRDVSAQHVVVRGDTLYGIAFRNKLDHRDLAAWNNISPPHTIYPGQMLRLSPPSRTTRVSRSVPVAAPSAVPGRERSTTAAPANASPPLVEPLPRIDTATATDGTETFAIRDEPAPSITATTAASAPDMVPTMPDQELSGSASADAVLPTTTVPTTAVPTDAVPPDTTTSLPPATAILQSVPTPVVAAVTESFPATALAVIDPRAPVREREGLRWRWPAAGRVIGRFADGDPTQQGIDIGGQLAQHVLAAADGEVVYSGNGLLGYGELVIVQHSPGFLSAYGHNQKRLVAEGARVVAGQPIAEMGRRGGIDMLHFEIRKNGRPVNPLVYLPDR
jgi:lipoprotein NlpD